MVLDKMAQNIRSAQPCANLIAIRNWTCVVPSWFHPRKSYARIFIRHPMNLFIQFQSWNGLLDGENDPHHRRAREYVLHSLVFHGEMDEYVLAFGL